MGYYTVLTPCVVGTLHYAHIPDQPIEVDEAVAADLVDSGALAPYRPGGTAEPVAPVAESVAHPQPRSRRKAGED